MIHIVMTEQDKADFIAASDRVLSDAAKFAAACVDILVSDYGAEADLIDESLFRYSATGKTIAGNHLPEPAEFVAETIRYIKPRYLGLER